MQGPRSAVERKEGDAPLVLRRMPTGIGGLDQVLHGGLFRSGVYMVMGRPGTGKTTLGNAAAPSELDLKKFLHELQVLGELFGCTTLLLTGSRGDADAHYAERTMVDGILHLTSEAHGSRATRYVEIVKHRGSDGLHGRHAFTIGAAGISVYPRLESLVGHAAPPTRKPAWISSGSASLDGILAGGIAANSVTGVVGAAGTGKTILALQFLADGAAAGERTHLLTFGEAPDSLRRRALTEHLEYDRLIKDGKTFHGVAAGPRNVGGLYCRRPTGPYPARRRPPRRHRRDRGTYLFA